MITFEVAFTPAAGVREQPAVHVLIDVVRATTVMVALMDRGARSIVLAANDQAARDARHACANALLIAESDDGSAAAGADCAPTLTGLRSLVVGDRPVILRSTNGTVAAREVAARPGVGLVGALINATAVMRAAVDLAAHRSIPVRLVCSGRESARSTSLDDVYCAGVLIARGRALAERAGLQARLRDSASIARGLVDRYGCAADALGASESAKVLRRIGCDEDILIAAETDTSTNVPMLRASNNPDLVEIGLLPNFAETPALT